MKTPIKLISISIACLSMSLLTACGGDGGAVESKPVTTISCSSNPHLVNAQTNTWQYSQTDTRLCTPLPNTLAGNCQDHQIKVRVPKTNQTTSNTNINCPVDINTGIRNCSAQGQPTATPYNPNAYANTNYNNNITTVSPDYHTTPGQYTEKCISKGDNSLGYVYSNGSYYYVNAQQLQNDVFYYQYQYQLSPEETLWTVGGLALLYLLLK